MGLLAVIAGQNSAFHTLNGQIEDQLLKLDRLRVQQIDQVAAKMSLEKLLVQVSGLAEELQAAVAGLGSQLEEKKGESDACRAQKVSTLTYFLISKSSEIRFCCSPVSVFNVFPRFWFKKDLSLCN